MPRVNTLNQLSFMVKI